VVDIDGGEIDVRLLGINAPEADECFYDAATDHLIDLLEGKTVDVEIIGTDQFGRTLAYLWMGGALVNLDLVSDGYAIATTPGAGEMRGNDLISAEDDAFSDRVGLWATDACGASAPPPSVGVDVGGSQFDPPGPDEDVLDQEWVTFVSEDVTDLEGWRVRDESSAHRCMLRSGSAVTPGQTLTLTSADPCWDPGRSPVWNNGGDLVLLLDPAGGVAARARYHD
jgi:hypothetical protein